MAVDFDTLVIGPLQGVFGEPAIYSPTIGSSFPISIVFDNAYKPVTISEYGPEAVAAFPAAGVQTSQFPNPPVQGDQLTVASNGKTYAVRKPEFDSHGGALLPLNYIGG